MRTEAIKDIAELRAGDIVINIGSGNAYVVIHNDGQTVTAVRAVTVTNIREWKRLKKQ